MFCSGLLPGVHEVGLCIHRQSLLPGQGSRESIAVSSQWDVASGECVQPP